MKHIGFIEEILEISSSKMPDAALFFRLHPDSGGIVVFNQAGMIPARDEMDDLYERLQVFYDGFGDEEVDAHNEQRYQELNPDQNHPKSKQPVVPAKSADWRRRRMHILGKRDGWQCHYCATPMLSYEEIRARYSVGENFDEKIQQFESEWIDLPPGVYWPTLDHKTPRSLGGTHDLDNLVLCCHPCNSKKSNTYTYTEFVALIQQPGKAVVS